MIPSHTIHPFLYYTMYMIIINLHFMLLYSRAVTLRFVSLDDRGAVQKCTRARLTTPTPHVKAARTSEELAVEARRAIQRQLGRHGIVHAKA